MKETQGIISSRNKEIYRVYLPESRAEIIAKTTGALRRSLEKENITPVTGDEVTLDRADNRNGEALILKLHHRRSLLTRVEVGAKGRAQPLAANVDFILICTSLNEEFNVNRLSRYFALADGANLPAILLLTKADLVEDADIYLREAASFQPPRQHILCSAVTGQGMEEVRALFSAQQTAVLLGSSGVGKSSLVNAILEDSRMKTAHTSAFLSKGRHTTTTRELLPLTQGGYLIDTPGMRGLALDQGKVETGFTDIVALAEGCRFNNCKHQHEPGCAVRQAVLEGRLDERRLANYQKLSLEQERRQAYHKKRLGIK